MGIQKKKTKEKKKNLLLLSLQLLENLGFSKQNIVSTTQTTASKSNHYSQTGTWTILEEKKQNISQRTEFITLLGKDKKRKRRENENIKIQYAHFSIQTQVLELSRVYDNINHCPK